MCISLSKLLNVVDHPQTWGTLLNLLPLMGIYAQHFFLTGREQRLNTVFFFVFPYWDDTLGFQQIIESIVEYSFFP